MPQTTKYAFNSVGIPELTPEYQAKRTIHPSSLISGARPLAIATTLEEQIAIAMLTNKGIPQEFQTALKVVQHSAYIRGIGAIPGIDNKIIINSLTQFFSYYEIPAGLLVKLTALEGIRLHFKIDDNDSMNNDSSVLSPNASPYMRDHIDRNQKYLTRWEEVEGRLHLLLELLAYIPTAEIILSRFDTPTQKGACVILSREEKSPVAFMEEAHAQIRALFHEKPRNSKPMLEHIRSLMNEANTYHEKTSRTMHYVFSDGKSNKSLEEMIQIKELLESSELNPLTFLACSNNPQDYEWMHLLKLVTPGITTISDFKKEQTKVLLSQGYAFPYSKGYWLLCNLLTALFPNDLGALAEHVPLTKNTLDTLMGRILMRKEYAHYFGLHPNMDTFAHECNQFVTTERLGDIRSVQIFKSTLAHLCDQAISKNIDPKEEQFERGAMAIAEKAVIYDREQRTAQLPGAISVSVVAPETHQEQNIRHERASQYPGTMFALEPKAQLITEAKTSLKCCVIL